VALDAMVTPTALLSWNLDITFQRFGAVIIGSAADDDKPGVGAIGLLPTHYAHEPTELGAMAEVGTEGPRSSAEYEAPKRDSTMDSEITESQEPPYTDAGRLATSVTCAGVAVGVAQGAVRTTVGATAASLAVGGTPAQTTRLPTSAPTPSPVTSGLRIAHRPSPNWLPRATPPTPFAENEGSRSPRRAQPLFSGSIRSDLLRFRKLRGIGCRARRAINSWSSATALRTPSRHVAQVV
jgi:hypothetical protein